MFFPLVPKNGARNSRSARGRKRAKNLVFPNIRTLKIRICREVAFLRSEKYTAAPCPKIPILLMSIFSVGILTKVGSKNAALSNWHHEFFYPQHDPKKSCVYISMTRWYQRHGQFCQFSRNFTELGLKPEVRFFTPKTIQPGRRVWFFGEKLCPTWSMIPPPRWWKELPDPWVWMLRLLRFLAGCWRGGFNLVYVAMVLFQNLWGSSNRSTWYILILDPVLSPWLTLDWFFRWVVPPAQWVTATKSTWATL